MENKIAEVLLLTWTVTPAKGIGASTLNNPTERLTDYLKALLFYISEPQLVDRILVFENSDFDFSVLKACLNQIDPKGRVHFINTDSNYEPSHGKGYAEFRMVDEGLRKSENLIGDARLWKVTGRLIIENIDAMISSAPRFGDQESIYCDLRYLPILSKKGWMDTRLFAFNNHFYQSHLKGRHGCHYVIEMGFYDIVRGLLNKGRSSPAIIPRFTKQPKIVGRSGFSSQSYQSGRYLLAHHTRRITRLITPWLWI